MQGSTYPQSRHQEEVGWLILFITSKTANLVPELAVEDLPLGRTAALVPEFAVKDLPFESIRVTKEVFTSSVRS